MEAAAILITMLFSLGLCALTMPWFITKMKSKGQAVRDYYKKDKKMMTNNAGILILFELHSKGDCAVCGHGLSCVGCDINQERPGGVAGGR